MCVAGYERSLVYFTSKTVPSVDAVGPGKIAYQITLAPNHDCKAAGVQAVADAVGATPEDPLRLCICVPGHVFRAWIRRKTPVPKKNKWSTDLASRVPVYIVCMEAPEAKF